MTTRPDDPWLTRERLLMLVLAGASVVVGGLCWRLVKPFVPAITWALVLAVLAHPLHEHILARFKKWPSISAALAVIAVTLAIALPATLLVRQVGSEAVASIAAAGKDDRRDDERIHRPADQALDLEQPSSQLRIVAALGAASTAAPAIAPEAVGERNSPCTVFRLPRLHGDVRAKAVIHVGRVFYRNLPFEVSESRLMASGLPLPLQLLCSARWFCTARRYTSAAV